MDMTIRDQLKAAIQAYKGPMTGNSIEAVWFRGAVRQLLDLMADEDRLQLHVLNTVPCVLARR